MQGSAGRWRTFVPFNSARADLLGLRLAASYYGLFSHSRIGQDTQHLIAEPLTLLGSWLASLKSGLLALAVLSTFVSAEIDLIKNITVIKFCDSGA